VNRSPAASVTTCRSDPAQVLRLHRVGRFDPTTRQERGEWSRATLTPAGPATIRLTWRPIEPAAAARVDERPHYEVSASAWGAGGDWLLRHVPDLLGECDAPASITPVHPQVAEALHRHGIPTFGRSLGLYHYLLPTIIGQRVTAGEARRSWRSICLAFGERAPGPLDLRLPPRPSLIAGSPYWRFHRHNIERKRADTLREVAAHAELLFSLDEQADAASARERLVHLRGVGQWTIGMALAPVFGDPDALAVGDFWLCHTISWALAGEARSDDQRMLELLAPYDGERGRVAALLMRDGWRAPRLAPGLPLIPIARL
jgi:3-methyladenine DNA glycosylase/8-oxoguanine DNA glycosylase